MGPRLPPLIALGAMLTLVSCGGGSTHAGTQSPESNGCRAGTPEAGVHNPDRLQVLAPCKHAAGIAVDVAHEEDGDYHIWFTVDPGYKYLLNAENHFQGKPAMLAEITPACPLDTNPGSAAEAAHCPKTNLAIPKLGDHVAVDGPWVFDADHGWNEIHPVNTIQVRGGG